MTTSAFIIVVVAFIVLYIRISNLNAKLEMAIREKKILPIPSRPVTFNPFKLPPVPPPQAISTSATIDQSSGPNIPPPADEISNKKTNTQTEFAVGGKIFTGIGALAVILAVGFFLRYAFQNNLISETVRVVGGGIFGFIIAGIGHFLRKKFSAYGQTLIGVGVGILYLATYAAYGFYELINMPLAFFILFCVTVLSATAALFYNSKPLFTWSLIGAFLIPFILPINASVHILFTYLLIVNSGVLLIARFKIWPEITVGNLLVTSLIYLQWVFGPYTDIVFIPTLVYSTVLFAVFFITSLLNFVFRNRDYKGIDSIFLYAIPIAYFFLNLTIITEQQEIAFFAFLIGLFYIIVSILIRAGFAQLGELRKFSNAMFLIASPFIATSIGLHFEGSTITMMWAAQAVIMALIGCLLNSAPNRIASLILAIIVGARFIAWETKITDGAQLLFNARSVTLVVLVLMFAVLWKLYSTYVFKLENANEDEKTAGKFIGVAGVFFTVFLWLNLESIDFITDYTLYVPLIWYLFSLVMISLSFIIGERNIRYFSYGVMAFGLILTVIFQSRLDPAIHPSFFNIRLLTTLIVVLAHIYILQLWKFNKQNLSEEEAKVVKASFLLTANGIILWAVSLEILQYFNLKIQKAINNNLISIENTKRVTLSVFWLIYALAGLAVGIIKRSHFARYFSIIIFSFTIFKIFLYDTANLNDIYRFVSFIILGSILLIAGFAYHKYKDRIAEFVGS